MVQISHIVKIVTNLFSPLFAASSSGRCLGRLACLEEEKPGRL